MAMNPLTVIGIFLLGASAGSLLTMIRYRGEIENLKSKLEQIRKEADHENEDAA